MHTIKVWDPLVRVFHWSLAGLFLANFFTEGGELVHRWIGYATLILITVRLVWGFVGSRHARFSDWVPRPTNGAATTCAQRLAGRSRRRLGHNPAAAVMIVSLLAGVVLVGLTGWLQSTERFFGEPWLEELHEVLAYGVLALVGLHVLAAIDESIHYRENLVASMIHGRKRALIPTATTGPDVAQVKGPVFANARMTPCASFLPRTTTGWGRLWPTACANSAMWSTGSPMAATPLRH